MKHPKYKRILPGQKVPDLVLDTTDGKQFDIELDHGKNFTLIVFYRGQHCPLCKENLKILNEDIDAFKKRGVNIIAVSMDSRDKAENCKEEWALNKLNIAYELTDVIAHQWGLFLSENLPGSNEPSLFTEPALFLIAPDQTLYAAWLQSVPFARPGYKDILKAIDYIQEKKYPPRGTHYEPSAESAAA